MQKNKQLGQTSLSEETGTRRARRERPQLGPHAAAMFLHAIETSGDGEL